MTDVTARLEVEIDGSQAAGEATRLEQRLDALKGKASGLDSQLNQLKRATDAAAGGLTKTGSGATATARAIEQMRTSTTGAIREMGGLARAAEDFGRAAARASAGMAGLSSSATANTQALARKRAAIQQLGVQFGDFTTQVSMGSNVFQAFGAQAGQAAAAATALGGTAGRIAAFFAGPWGSAVIAATTVLGMMASKYLDNKEAAEAAEKAAAAFAKRQDDMANFIDRATGKLKEQNQTLLQNAVLRKQDKIDANNDIIRQKRDAASDLADHAAITSRRFVSERQPFAPVFDPAIAKVIADAKGNVEKLDAGFRELAKRRPELRGIAKEISDQAAAAVAARRENQGLAKDIDALNGKTGSSFEALSDKIRAETDQTFAVSKRFEDSLASIQKRLKDSRITEAQAAAELRTAYAKRAAGLETIAAAEEARRKAAADGRKADREALKDARDLERAYEGLIAKYQPAEAAAAAYRRELSTIDELLAKRKIAPADADFLALKAGEDYARNLGRAYEGLVEQYDGMTAAASDYAAELERINSALAAKAISPQQASDFQRRAEQRRVIAEDQAVHDRAETFARAFEIKMPEIAEAGGKTMADHFRRDALKAADAIGYAIGGKLGQVARAAVASIRAAQTGDYDKLGVAIGGKTGAAIDAFDALFGGKDNEGKADHPLATAFGKEMKKAFGPLEKLFKDVKDDLDGFLKKSLGIEGGLKDALAKVGVGIQQGKLVDGVFDTLGIKSSGTGAKVGGAIGNVVGGPVGGWIGAAAGGLLGGMLKKTPKSSINLSLDGEGDFTTNGLRAQGKGKGVRRDATQEFGDSFGDALERLADAFGSGLAKGLNLGSLGTRDDKFTFDPTGQGRTKKKFGAQQFTSQEDAIEAAITNAIDKGVIKGIRESTKRLLTAGGDFQAALDKAVRFENVFKELEQRKDPKGFALKELDREFAELRDIFKEASASTEEYAQLEELYQIKRLDIINEGNDAALDAMKANVEAMQDYLRGLTTGQGTGLTAQTRLANSRAELAQLDADRAMGKAVDFDTYRSVADAFLAASREFNGSTKAYFSDLERITRTVEQMIAAGGGDTLAKAAATQAAPTLDERMQTLAAPPVPPALPPAALNASPKPPTSLARRLQTMAAANDPHVGAVSSAAAKQPSADTNAVITALRAEGARVIAELQKIGQELGTQTDQQKETKTMLGGVLRTGTNRGAAPLYYKNY